MVDDELTDDHVRLLEWLATHPTESLASAAQALGLALTDVEGLCADLVDAEMVGERGCSDGISPPRPARMFTNGTRPSRAKLAPVSFLLGSVEGDSSFPC